MTHLLRRGAFLIALVIGLGLAGPTLANPFARDAAPAAGERAEPERVSGPLAAFGRAMITFQRESNRLISQHMRAVRDGESMAPVLVAAALAFLYGVVHALGPGHGKLVVVSYFLAREARIVRGLLMGLQIAVFHVLSAMVVVALADLLLRRAFGGPPAEVAEVRLASYGLIALIGALMLVQAVRRSRQRRAGQAVGDGCCGHAHAKGGEQGALSLGVGLVPCTGSMLILLYAMANDILLAGMVLVAAIAAGMAITMGALGLLSIVARQAVASRLGSNSRGSSVLAVVSDYGGALVITAIGAGLMWSSLQS
jgi:nickel/cobalt transporter (NicO) family protein